MDPEVRIAAAITLALRSHPEMKDSMFAAHDRLVATPPVRSTLH